MEQSMDWTKSHERRPTRRRENRGDAKANTDREKLCREGEVHEGGQHTMKTLRVPLTTASAPSVKAEKDAAKSKRAANRVKMRRACAARKP